MTQFRKREYTLELVTPAFLGGSDQSAEWRTPGIKALIRQWWRVAYVAEYGVNVNAMREAEGILFGTVNGEASQAKVRIRLGEWKVGNLTQMPAGGQVRHPEVGNGGRNINAFLYLGYGPLANAGTGVTLNKERALSTQQSNSLTIIGKDLTQDEWTLIDQTMHYIALFGVIGGRSRNGWGSLSVKQNDQLLATLDDIRTITTKTLAHCFQQDWPSSIGSHNNRSLVWQGAACTTWEAALNSLAAVKIGFRTDLGFNSGNNTPTPEGRHFIAYPVTNHSVSSWVNQKRQPLRLPNSLRFKVFKQANNQFVPLAFHLPHQLPDVFSHKPKNNELTQVWQQVYDQLDNSMTRI